MIEPFRQIPVAALVAALVTSVATFYVVLGGVSLSNKRRGKGPRGLTNSGRSCYMNAVLQAFASSPSVQRWLIDNSRSPLKAGLLKCLRLLNRQEESPSEDVTPSDLFVALRSQGFVITGEEQDAHELVQGLLDVIETDNNTSESSQDPFDFGEDNLQSSPGVVNRLGRPNSIKRSDSSSPFSGRMTCRVDNKRESSPTKSLMFNNITLYLSAPCSMQPITLESLLQTFVALEHVEDTTTKQQSFARLPRVLVLHIQRTAFNCGMAYKRQDKVSFPFFLHMDKFIYAQQLCQKQSKSDAKLPENRNTFQLCAVICHFGEIESGHYITYRQCSLPGGKIRWYYTSDGDVHQVTLDQVMGSNPYILLYERYQQPESRLGSTASTPTAASALTCFAPKTLGAENDTAGASKVKGSLSVKKEVQ